ncbi:fibronectin type III domain-containing protein [Patescibacteria group bacterium]|nr:fibronectin type III domain-containing protein [Patescibacteria group bacterium]
MNLKKVFGFLVIFFYIGYTGGIASAAVMSSTNYKIQIDSVNVGGERQTSASYRLEQTVGEQGTGKIEGSIFNLFGGFLIPFISGVAATPTPAPAAGPGLGRASGLIFQISDIVVRSVTSDTAVVEARTNKIAIAQIDYGLSEKYDQIVVGEEFEDFHIFELKNLLPNTRYHFKVRATDKSGAKVDSGNLTFKTLPFAFVAPPLNVSNFQAVPGDEEIALTWENPLQVEATRIMRSTEFYPTDPFEGDLVYEGTAESFIDTGLENKKRYYYTAFARDADGDYASGVVVSAVPQAVPLPEIPPPPEIPLVPPEFVPESLRDLSLEDFDFIQKGAKLPIIKGQVDIEPDALLTISLDYEKVPEVLKTILVSLEDTEGKAFSFLLRVNKDKTRYMATLLAPDPGNYPMKLTVMDFKNQGLQKVGGNLFVKPFEKPQPAFTFEQYVTYIILALFLFVVYLAIRYLDRQKKKKQQQETNNIK